MAFQVPHAPHRRTSYSKPQLPILDIPPSSEESPDDTTQWVLFSPTARTHTTSTERTRTVGGTRLSDFGSLAATRSANGIDDEDTDALDDQIDEDGTELDSLDDGLHAFRAPSLGPTSPTRVDQGPQAMLPVHDGLGSFQPSSQTVQDQIWQHEQYNPQRLSPHLQHRRHSSIQRHLDTAEKSGANTERERWQRIEQWRRDQSRALFQEIERETRQRRASHTTSHLSVDRPVSHTTQPSVSEPLRQLSPPEGVSADEQSFWCRITHKVIRDLIGIDDALLSVIFGESLPLDAQSHTQDESLDMETILAREQNPGHDDTPPWQTTVLQHIARELGVLVNQFCEHPGAFSTYYQMTKDISAEYAGMPLDRLAENSVSPKADESNAPSATNTAGEPMLSPQFIPTLRDVNREHEAQWGIEDDPMESDSLSESAKLRQESEYWERGLDVTMVFRYLRSRFSRRGYMHNDPPTDTSTPPRRMQDASRRAAIIRHHHPLVARAHSRSQTQTRRPPQYSGISNSAAISSPLLRSHLRRPSSSCASQSAKLSAISSKRTMTGSSRNYWDIGGSESNSAIGVGAGLGTWAEV